MINIDDFSPELKQKAMQCKTNEELASLAKSEGIELDEDVLDTIAGGDWSPCFTDCCDVHI